MSKLNILKKTLEVIHESLPEPIDTNAGGINEVSEEQAIKELAKEFAKALNDRDFQSLESKAEYHLYTVDHLIELIKANDEQNTIKLFKEYKIISRYEDCNFLAITFDEELQQAEVVCNVRICLIDASANYFKELNKKRDKESLISAGVPFEIKYVLGVKKVKGIWKVDSFKTSDQVNE